jgi:hypothetical protein
MDISNRKTVSKRIPELDSLYVYTTRHKVKLTHRKQEGIGYRYTVRNAILKAKEGEIHIYHRTAKIRGLTHGLTMVTKNAKFRDVQKWINEQIKLIESDDKLFDKFSHAKPTPAELGLYFVYGTEA